ncbi:MAG TPA: aromatic amino acid lyase [Streptosporangiaceae bacterium]|nr:aromatic amino acid lyase [Streptosporangiaceae bacterium]
MAAAHVLASATDLGPELILQVAAGDQVSLGPQLTRQVDQRCAAARAVLAAGQPVYGVTTGMGALSGVRLTEAQQREHQGNLLLGRATGGPPWLSAADVRALFAVRLANFLTGDAGVSAALCRRLTDFLAAGLTPAVPALGAGTAGEIVQNAHAFGPLTGTGSILAAGGEVRPASEALADSGLPEFSLGPKEGIALLAGVPGATALSLLGHAEAGAVTAMMEAAAALSIAAIGAPGDPYEALCARGDDIHGAVLARLRARLGHAGPAGTPGAGRPPRMLQAPVSFRVAGPVLAHLVRAAGALFAAAGRALSGVTDSPAFAGDRFLGTAGFHGIDLAAHCDQLTAAVAHAAEVSAARTHRLLDARVTGLPAQLAARPGPDAGLVAVHKRAAGEVHALRRLAAGPAAGTIETSNGQEDVQSFAWPAAMNLRAALRHARLVTACELLTAFQAATLAGDAVPDGCAGLLATLTGLVEPVTADRPLGPDIERLAAACWAD